MKNSPPSEINLASLGDDGPARLTCLLAEKRIFKTKGGKPFGALALEDASGRMSAKLWERAEELLAPLAAGAPVRVAGRMQVYNGQRQMVLDAIEAAPDADPAQFMPRSPHDPDELWAELQKLVRSVRNQHLAKALKAFFGDADFRGRFRTAPAAKGAHHAYVHGLLEHTVSVGGLARLAADHYGRLNRDLLTAGALLHDVGKVREFSLGPPIDYTDEGRLEGHLVLGVRMLDRRLARLRGFPSELAGHLRHLILSHHGRYEFGSPKKPKTPEAMVLHLIDDLDAKTAMIQAVLEREGGGESHWSSFNRLLERCLYTGPSPLAEPEAAPPAEAEPGEQPVVPSLFDQ